MRACMLPGWRTPLRRAPDRDLMRLEPSRDPGARRLYDVASTSRNHRWS